MLGKTKCIIKVYLFNYIRGDDDLRCYRCNKIHKYDKINDDASSTTSTTSSEGIIKLIIDDTECDGRLIRIPIHIDSFYGTIYKADHV